MVYNWQLANWPNFQYDFQNNEALFSEFAEALGEISGIIHTLEEKQEQETLLQIMLSEAIKSSEIEGEYISRHDVMSSLKKNLGLTSVSISVKDKKASGIA